MFLTSAPPYSWLVDGWLAGIGWLAEAGWPRLAKPAGLAGKGWLGKSWLVRVGWWYDNWLRLGIALGGSHHPKGLDMNVFSV
jgi:hypothetical protein